LFLLAFFLAAPLSVVAEESTADAEARLDTGLKEFGYLAGLSRGCVTSEQVAELEREVLDLHAAIGRLLGTDRAFLFAAAFGNGTSLQIPVEECQDVLSRYEAQAEPFRASRRLQ
jgi:hypothetical protein